MSEFVRFTLRWSLVVLCFDLIASWTSLLTGIPYGWFAIGSIAVYFAVAYSGGRRFGRSRAVGATTLVTLCDGTLGQVISWSIVPGEMAPPGLSVAMVVLGGVIGTVILGAIVGLIGGWVGARRVASQS